MGRIRTYQSAILAAKAAGFDAVECHWPYDTDPKADHWSTSRHKL